MGARIVVKFPRRPGRTYGYNALTPALAPDVNAGVLRRPLPQQGNPTPASAPASRQIIDGGAARGNTNAGDVFNNNDRDLNGGPVPTRIRRDTRATHSGAVQKGTGIGGVTGPLSFDPKTDGGSLYIPHQRIPRVPKTVTAFARTFDFNATIPARGIGAPVKSR